MNDTLSTLIKWTWGKMPRWVKCLVVFNLVVGVVNLLLGNWDRGLLNLFLSGWLLHSEYLAQRLLQYSKGQGYLPHD